MTDYITVRYNQHINNQQYDQRTLQYVLVLALNMLVSTHQMFNQLGSVFDELQQTAVRFLQDHDWHTIVVSPACSDQQVIRIIQLLEQYPFDVQYYGSRQTVIDRTDYQQV